MGARRPVMVVIARFEDLVARGLRALIEEDRNLDVAAFDVPQVELDRVLDALRPDVAIVDLSSLRTPVELRELHRAHPRTRLVVLAHRPSPVECNQMLAFGATACLSKETQGRDVLNAIHLASRGLHVIPRPGDDRGAAPPPRPGLLTRREAEVLELLQQGRSNAQIAAALQVGVETVRTHARNIYRKLGVRTRRELATLSVLPARPPDPDGGTRPPAG